MEHNRKTQTPDQESRWNQWVLGVHDRQQTKDGGQQTPIRTVEIAVTSLGQCIGNVVRRKGNLAGDVGSMIILHGFVALLDQNDQTEVRDERQQTRGFKTNAFYRTISGHW